ncbi:Unannotated [Lentimonas sp. CC19]|nr:Unannotated [Lentimonas sp. CC4]CAA6684662.1 Unannotated [Lentimonas sp. CC6]CAA6694152.1 Unannotated [Lentimonas sp. CC19]CAA6694352.1 Unannotated [Lentimonas sp. CC10]CAA7070370.1 Unannotated [Lentimonas sp. CC11]CAA7170683.1 Unannotated [Lentimonas sp. CC21]CAA7182294.1 Unannotated [Lentimonas sp. CC8]
MILTKKILTSAALVVSAFTQTHAVEAFLIKSQTPMM